MALDKDIVGSIEFLEVLGLEGSTYLLKGPNGEQVKFCLLYTSPSPRDS